MHVSNVVKCVCVCVCSNEELEKFLDEKEGPVLVEKFVRNLDAVSHRTIS